MNNRVPLLAGCTVDWENPESILAALKTDVGKRVFRIVVERVNTVGWHTLNEDDKLYEYLMGQNKTSEDWERQRDWGQVFWALEECKFGIEGISMSSLSRVRELLK